MVRKRAMIVKLGQIGDVIMAIPAVHSLSQQGFEIDWVCGRAVQSLLACYSWINIIPVNDKAILFGPPLQRAKEIARLWKNISPQKYNFCATLYYDRRYRLLTLPVRAARKLFLSESNRATSLIAGRHHTDEYARILLGLEDSCMPQSTAPIRPDRLPLIAWEVRTVAKRIALVPGGVNHLIREQASQSLPEQALRRWPVESYVVLAQELNRRGWEVVLLGGPDDTWVKPYFQSIVFTDYFGTLSLPEVVSGCDACDAIVTHDSGPLHLAGLSKTCVVGVFGPTDPATRVPRRSSVVGVWGGQDFACRPCYNGYSFAPCQFNGCMHQVTPELVLRELDRLLAEKSQEGGRPWRVVSPDIAG